MPTVLALLSRHDAARLGTHLDRGITCRRVHDWPDFRAYFERQSWDLAIVDPQVISLGPNTSAELVTIGAYFARRPAYPVVLALSGAKANASARILRLAKAHVLWKPVDELNELCAIISQVIQSRPAAHIERSISERALHMEGNLREVLFDLFEHPEYFPSAKSIAASAAVSRRKLYQAFQEVGFAAPHALMRVARVAKLYWMVGVQLTSLKAAMNVVGVNNERTTRRQVRSLLGVQPNRLSTALTSTEAVERLISGTARVGSGYTLAQPAS